MRNIRTCLETMLLLSLPAILLSGINQPRAAFTLIVAGVVFCGAHIGWDCRKRFEGER